MDHWPLFLFFAFAAGMSAWGHYALNKHRLGYVLTRSIMAVLVCSLIFPFCVDLTYEWLSVLSAPLMLSMSGNQLGKWMTVESSRVEAEDIVRKFKQKKLAESQTAPDAKASVQRSPNACNSMSQTQQRRRKAAKAARQSRKKNRA